MKTDFFPILHAIQAHKSGSAIRSALISKLTGLWLSMHILLIIPVAEAQSFEWARKLPNAGASQTAVSADTYGNSYMIGTFTGTVTLGSYTLTSLGNNDIYIVKYNASGSVVWARRIGGSGADTGGDISISRYGDYVYVTGTFSATTTFGTYHGYNVNPLSSRGGTDIFVAQYDAATGTFSWARQAGGTLSDNANGIFVDESGNAYITGSFTGTSNFSTSTIVYNLASSSGSSDIFMAKYNSAGTMQFARRLGSSGYDYGAAVTVDKYEGNIYITGGYSPTSHPYIVNVVVAKWNSAGTFQWQRVTGTGSYIDSGSDIAVDGPGYNIYVVGNFGASITFGSTTLTSVGSGDVFVTCYRDNGNVNWAKRYGGPNWDEGQGIAVESGVIYISGTFNGSATFGHTTFSATSGTSDRDMFIARLFSNGEVSWARRIGSIGYDYGRGAISIPRYSTSTVYLTGHYSSTLSLGSASLSGPGSFLTKITPPVMPSIAELRLINAATDVDVKRLYNFETINYGTLGTNKINIKANTSPSAVGSVVFNLDGIVKTENYAPYAYAGDQPKSGGGIDYLPFTPAVGSHRLEITAYSGPNGTGVKGTTSLTFFTVVTSSSGGRLASHTLEDDAEGIQMSAKPNPFTDRTVIQFTAVKSGPVQLQIIDMKGTLIEHVFEGEVEAGQQYAYEINGSRLAAGMYIGRLATPTQLVNQKLIVVK